MHKLAMWLGRRLGTWTYYTVWVVLLGLSPLAQAQNFHLPSSLAIMGGGDKAGSKNMALDLLYSTQNNWQLSLGSEQSTTVDEENSSHQITKGYNFSVGTDPLEEWAGILRGESWQMDDDIKSGALALGVQWAPGSWVLSLEGQTQKYQLSHLPKLLFTNGESEFLGRSISGTVEYFGFGNWSLRVFSRHFSYNEDLSNYGEGVRVRFMPSAVLTSVTGLANNDTGFGFGYSWSKVSTGFEAASSRSALDGVKVLRLTANVSGRIAKSWQTGLSVGSSRPEGAEEDSSPTAFANLSLSYSWR